MMARAFSKLISCTSSGVGLGVSTLVRRDSHHVPSGWSADFYRSILPGEEACLLEGLAARTTLLCRSADPERLEGCRDRILLLLHCAELYFSPILRIKLEKVEIWQVLPVTVGLGESMAVALNALAPVPATGGGERFCAQGLPICSMLFL